MTYLPPPKGAFDVEWATQNNRIIQQELGRLQPLQVRVADLESGKQPLDGDLTAIAALTGTGYIRRTADDTWAISATIPNTSVTGLGTASTQNTGTSGATIPFLNGNNTWSGTNGFQAVTATTLSTTGNATLVSSGTGTTSIGGPEPSTNPARLNLLNVTDEAASVVFNMYKARGSLGSETDLLTGDTGGAIRTYLRNNGAWATGSNLRTRILDATAGAMDTAVQILVSDSGSIVQRFEVNPDGASITGTISASNLAGTTYTPTLRSTVDVNIASSTFQSASYIRVGSAVMATIQLFITPTASGSVRFSISLPVASNFTTNYQLGGNCAARDTVPLAGMVIGSATNDNAVAEFVAATTNAHEVTLQIFYPIL